MSSSATFQLTAHRGRRLMFIAAACFVANVLLIRALGQGGGDVWTISALRFASGLALCLLFQRRSLDVTALFTKPRLILRGLMGGVSTYAFYLAIVHLGAGRAVFLNNTYVILSSLLAVWMLREQFRLSLATGAFTALIGLGLLTGAIFGRLHIGLYDLVAIGSALAAAWIVVAIRQLHQEGVPTATIFASQCIYGLLLCAPFLLTQGAPVPSAGATLGLIAAGVLAAAGQLTMTSSFRDLTVAEGTLIQALVPLGIAAGGILFFGEALGWQGLVGGLLIVGGSILPTLFGTRSEITERS
jgi:drug/metabolite transporter (DMT)-like permease